MKHISFDIVFFSLLAVFLIYKLKSILGREDDDLNIHQGKSSGRKKKFVDITNKAETIKANNNGQDFTDYYQTSKKNNKDKNAPDVKTMCQKLFRYNPLKQDPIDLVNSDIRDKFMSVLSLAVTEDVPNKTLHLVQHFVESFANIIDAYDAGKLDKISTFVSVDMYSLLDTSIKNLKESGIRNRLVLVKINDAKIVNVDNGKKGILGIDIEISSQQTHFEQDINSNSFNSAADVISDVTEICSFTKNLYDANSHWLLTNIKSSS